MASQITKHLDTEHSYVPVDPKAFPENYMVTSREEANTNKKVVPYEGYNFMPTSYGYKSFFGLTAQLDVDAIPSRVDDVFIFQTLYLDNIAVALCEDGIWTKNTTVSGAWEHSIELEVPPEGTVLTWTYCTIKGDLYCYRAQGAQYYKMASESTMRSNGDEFFLDTNGIVLAETSVGLLPPGVYSYYVAPIYADGSIGSHSSPKDMTTSASNKGVAISWNNTDPLVVGFRIYRVASGVTSYIESMLTSASPAANYPILSGFVDTGSVTGWQSLTGTPADYGVLAQAGVFFPVTPNFLNMEGQQGIFKAGGRLGFWDSLNSISWSSIDDFSDFEPAILTNAGNTIFQEISGKIVSILGHGEHFIVYSTGSIVLINQQGSSMQWESSLLMKGAGIVYPREACAGVPSTTHYAYSDVGLLRIEKGVPTIIVPEVTDFLKEASLPVYLRMIEGRYLFLEIMDSTYINGLVSFTESTIPTSVVNYSTHFPINKVEDITLPSMGMPDTCRTLKDVGLGLSAQQQEQAEEARVTNDAPPKKNNTNYEPVWKCFLSKGPVGGDIEWTTSPCAVPGIDGSEPFPMSPSSSILNASVRPPLVENDSAYIDGWTIERFIAVQTALWEAEDNARNAWRNAVGARVSPVTTAITHSAGWHQEASALYNPALPASSSTFCELGEIMTRFTAPVLRLGPCSFSLFRLGYEKVALRTKTNTGYTKQWTTRVRCNSTLNLTAWGIPNNLSMEGATPEALGAYIVSKTANVEVPAMRDGNAGVMWCSYSEEDGGHEYIPSSPTQGFIRLKIWFRRNSNGVVSCYDPWCNTRGTYIITEYRVSTTGTRAAYNIEGPPTPQLLADAPYCTIVAWKYKGEDGEVHTIPATTCSMEYPELAKQPQPDDDDGNGKPKPPTQLNNTSIAPNLVGTDGSICGIAFKPVTIPGINAGNPIDWTTAPSFMPPVSFLLQKGSIAPIYPTMHGALVYDTQLKKWGKMKNAYRVLVDWQPINANTFNIIPFEVFGVKGGLVGTDNKIYLFDENPIDSKIRYGKIGYTKQGVTSAEEIRVTFRSHSTGVIITESSLNASTIETSLTKTMSFTNATEIVMFPSTTARWHTILFTGRYDIKHIEYRGTDVGNR